MLQTTVDICRSALKSDPTVTVPERTRLLARLRNGAPPEPPAPSVQEPRLISRTEAARRLGRSVRLIDALAAAGHLNRVKLPGRKLAAGFLCSNVDMLIVGMGGVV